MPVYQHDELKAFVHVPHGRLLYVYTSEAMTQLATLTDIDDASIDNPIVLGESDACWALDGYGGTALFKSASSPVWVISDYSDDVVRPLYPIDETTMVGLTASIAEMNLLDGVPAAVVITHAAGAANIVNVTFTVNDAAGAPVDKPTFIDVWLSDAATALAITGHAADTIAATKGSVWHVHTAGAAIRLQTAADGVATIAVTDTHKTTSYVAAALGIDPRPNVIHHLAGADYGA